MKISILIEDSKIETADDRLINEFGLSVHVRTRDHEFLVDTGQSGQFVLNAGHMGIDLKKLDFAVISHGHFDHGGGLETLLETVPNLPVYMHKTAENASYANVAALMPDRAGQMVFSLTGTYKLFSKFVGLNPKTLNRYAGNFHPISQSVEIFDNIYLLNNISQNHARPTGNRFLQTLEDGHLVPDRFEHEIVLAVRESDGIVLFSGCCHNGILNVMDTALQFFEGQPIKAVVGGFHLTPGTDTDIDRIARELIRHDVKSVYTGHCTGEYAYHTLKQTLKKRLKKIQTGLTFDI